MIGRTIWTATIITRYAIGTAAKNPRAALQPVRRRTVLEPVGCGTTSQVTTLPATSTTDSDKQWLLGNVRNLAFTFYDGATWTDSWDSTTKTNLPRAIKVQVELAAADPAQPAPAPLEVVVPILVTGRTNQTAAATTGGQP